MHTEAKVRAFKRSHSTLIKYYDDGRDAEQVTCPYCHWAGKSELARSPSAQGHSLLRCPECATVLGTIFNQRVINN